MTEKLDKAVASKEVAPRKIKSNYPEPFASRMEGRVKRPLGDLFGLKSFGINMTELLPGGESSVLHKHTKQEEFIYVLEGHPTLIREGSEQQLNPGDCAGFTPESSAHKLVNRTEAPVLYLEMGNRDPADAATYPQDDLVAQMGPEGKWLFFHKNGEPY